MAYWMIREFIKMLFLPEISEALTANRRFLLRYREKYRKYRETTIVDISDSTVLD